MHDGASYGPYGYALSSGDFGVQGVGKALVECRRMANRISVLSVYADGVMVGQANDI